MSNLQAFTANRFLKTIKAPAEATRPTTPMGTSITPGTNAYTGTYTTVIDGSTAWGADDGDAYEIHININNVGVSTAAHASMINVGIDMAGGTSYTLLIADLMGGPASAYSGVAGSMGVWYVFPLRIPRGSSIGVDGMRSVGTTAFGVMVHLKCKPTAPENLKVGSFVRSFGAAASGTSPNGTVVTPGTTAEGAWTASIATTAEDLFYWEVGLGADSASTSLNLALCDVGVGDASNKSAVIDDAEIQITQTETIYKAKRTGQYAETKAGDLVYLRAQIGPNGAPTNFTMMAYAVG